MHGRQVGAWRALALFDVPFGREQSGDAVEWKSLPRGGNPCVYPAGGFCPFRPRKRASLWAQHEDGEDTQMGVPSWSLPVKVWLIYVWLSFQVEKFVRVQQRAAK